MKLLRSVRFVLVLGILGGASGCVTGKVLTLPGDDLARPGKKVPARAAAAAPSVAVLDFSYDGAPPHEIGRDFDHARSIVWNRNPGKAMADLVAWRLAEKGVPAVRVPDEPSVPPGVPAKVWGSVDRFRVEARKSGALRLKVETAASVSVTVHGAGGDAPAGWNSSVGSETRTIEPLFVTPDGVRDTVSDSANAVAEEIVRRLAAAGVVSLRPETPPDVPKGQPPGEPGKEGK